MIQTLLIANRGEIACRIIRTCQKLGIRTAAVYSEADAGALHVKMADAAYLIGAAPPNQSYLSSDNILAAAKRAGAEAIHPGFGFLAENAAFAEAVQTAGLIFIGPSAAAIAMMGDKRAAKELAAKNNVPTIPGYNAENASDDDLISAAENIGFPIMVKASAGGGGKGMRLVGDAADLPSALEAARNEALKAFGSDALILEQALLKPRHIEIQILGDHYGKIIHLGERECSIQRRHQKVIEEAPAVDPDLRAKMGAAAVRMAAAVGYHNAGTVEFLLDQNGDFYFLEMNTRLQVEHPVTELITGLDLVEWQIRIAEGEALPFSQDEISFKGHALEARLYAENPANDFLPSTGQIALWEAPQGEGLRIESGIQTGDEVSIYYDPMLAKLIAYGSDRQTAARRLAAALDKTVLFGVSHNLAFLRDILRHDVFLSGNLHTGFIGEHFQNWAGAGGDLEIGLIAAAGLVWLRDNATGGGYWRNNPNGALQYAFVDPAPLPLNRAVDPAPLPLNRAVDPAPLSLNRAVDPAPLPPPHRRGGEMDVYINPQRDGRLRVKTDLGEAEQSITELSQDQTRLNLTLDGARYSLPYAWRDDRIWIKTPTGDVHLQISPRLPKPHSAAHAGGSLRAPMPGAVIAVLVHEGQQVEQGQALMKLEAMKMEHTISSAAAGVIEAIYYAVGDSVAADAQLLKIGR